MSIYKKKYILGEPAIEYADEIKEIQVACTVSNHEYKRYIFKLANERDETDRFKKRDLYLELGLPRLQKFFIKSEIDKKFNVLFLFC